MSNINDKQATQKPNEVFGKILNPKYVQRGIIIFIGITLASFTALFFYQNSSESLNALKQVQLGYIFLGLGLAFLDWWIGGIRNHVFVRILKKGISWRVCFDANMSNVFLGAVTPSQSGGGAAQLFVLWRHGVKISDGIAVAIINYISTILFFVGSAGLAIWYLQNDITNSLISTLVKTGFMIFTIVMIAILLSLIFPKRMGNLLMKIASFFSKKTESRAKKVAEQLTQYHETMMLFIAKKPIMLPFSFIITTILYFNKYLIAYVLLLGLGIVVPFWTVIAIQSIIFFMIYFSPSPGASGIAEISIATLMSQIVADSIIPSFTILHRVFLLLLPAMIGAFVFLKELKKQAG